MAYIIASRAVKSPAGKISGKISLTCKIASLILVPVKTGAWDASLIFHNPEPKRDDFSEKRKNFPRAGFHGREGL